MKVKDTTKFTIDQLHNYNLLLQFGNSGFEMAVVDPRSGDCLLVEDFSLKSVNGNYLDLVKSTFDQHHLLLAGFWKSVKIAFKNNKFTLVPVEYFDKEKKQDYLKLNSRLESSDTPHYYKLIKSDTVNIFAANNELVEWLRSVYKRASIQVLHQSSSFIEGVLQHNDHALGKNMFLLLDGRSLHILVTENKKIIFYNQFIPENLKQLLRDVLLIMKAMKMSPKDNKVIIWGKVNAESSVFKGLYKYIRYVSLGTRPSFLKFNYMFDEIPDARFFDLYSLNLCN